jgi:hypothetical protein
MTLGMRIVVALFALWRTQLAMGNNSHEVTPLQTTFDERYGSACGPIACYTACHWLGEKITLGQIISDTGWKEGHRMSLGQMHDYLESRGLDVQAIHLDPEALSQTLLNHQPTVALLLVRSDSQELDHVVAAVGVHDSLIDTVDYPSGRHRVSIDQLSDMWDGSALLVKGTSGNPNSPTNSKRDRLVYGIGAIIASIFILFHWKWHRPLSSTGTR